MSARALAIAGRAGVGIAWLILAAVLLTFPGYPSVQLDDSWRIALATFYDERLQFGRDVVFTYGPLGFLQVQLYTGQHLWAFLAVQVVWAAVWASAFAAIAAALGWWRGAMLCLAVVIVGTQSLDGRNLFLVLLIGCALIGLDRKRSPLWDALWTTLLAALALIKFTHFMLAVLCVGGALLVRLLERRVAAALRVAACFAAGMLVAWLLARQNPLLFPAWVFHSWHVSQGYLEAMALDTPPHTLVLGIAIVGLTAVSLLLSLAGHERKILAFVPAALVAAFTFMAWKHGFVRSDEGHLVAFYTFTTLVGVALPALLRESRRWRVLQQTITAGIAAVSVFALYDLRPADIRNAPARTIDQLASVRRTLADLPSYRRDLEDAVAAQRQAVRLPRVQAAVGTRTVDVLGNEAAVAVLNGLRYRPRPVFQSYDAYNEDLIELNERFYESDRAPDFVLVRVQTIDDRFPTLDDARVLRVLPRRYEFVLAEGEYELWKRRRAALSDGVRVSDHIASHDATLGESIRLESFASDAAWATIRLTPTLLGRIVAFLYKLPPVHLEIEDTEGHQSSFTLPVSEARTGFIVSPIIDDTAAYALFAGGQNGRRARSITVTSDVWPVQMMKPGFDVAFERLPAMPRDPSALGRAMARRFAMFKTFPLETSAAIPPNPRSIDGQPVLMMHAPSRMAFALDGTGHHVSGAFGFVGGAYENGGQTDGAQFTIWCGTNNQRQVLLSRLLDPQQNPQDRGLQKFDLQIPCSSDQLHMDVDPGSKGDSAWDWTSWTDISVR